jgi:hypothetical protein
MKESGRRDGTALPGRQQPAQQGREAPAIDIRRLADKVYALFLAEVRRAQAHGIRRAPRGRG